MAEWKKILTNNPSPADLKGTGAAEGKVLTVDGSGGLEWGDDIGIDVVSDIPITAEVFTKGNGTFLLHSSSGSIDSDNDVYFLTNDGTAIMKIPAELGKNLAFNITSFDHDLSGGYQLIGPTSNAWKVAGALNFTAAYDNDATVTGSVTDISINDRTIVTSITSTGNTPTAFDNASNILFPDRTDGISKLQFQLNVSNTDPDNDAVLALVAVYFENYWYAGALTGATANSQNLRDDLAEQIIRDARITYLNSWQGTTGMTVTGTKYLYWAYPNVMHNESGTKISDLDGDRVILAGTTNKISDGNNGQVVVGMADNYGGPDYDDPATVDHWNANSFQESYYAYRSELQYTDDTIYWDMGDLKNYIYSGRTSLAFDDTWDSAKVLGGTNCTLRTSWASNDDHLVNDGGFGENDGSSVVWPDNTSSISVTASQPRVYFALPNRLSDAGIIKFYDPNSANFEMAFSRVNGASGTVSVTNVMGYTEDYIVYVTDDTLYASGEANTIRFWTDNV